MTRPRRRQSGEGSISEYATKAGPRYLIKYAREVRDDGSKVYTLKRGYATRADAAKALREKLREVDQGTHVAPNQFTVAQHFDNWLAIGAPGSKHRGAKGPTTLASYRKNVRLHVAPHVGSVKLEKLRGNRLDQLYRLLLATGRADGSGGLSARTVRYVHTIIHSALAYAVRQGLVARNEAERCEAVPSAKEAASPEMHVWKAEELRAFLAQRAAADDELLTAWTLLATTGMRRGEALALQWRDVDFDASRLAVRRSATVVKNKGEGQEVVVGPPKSGKPRTVDIDEATVAALRAHRKVMGSISLTLVRDDVPVLADLSGRVRHPERFSRRWDTAVRQARAELGEDALSSIRLHDLRHTHATLLLAAGEPVKVVSERLGHSSSTITLGVYAHVMPGMQASAAARFGALLAGGAP